MNGMFKTFDPFPSRINWALNYSLATRVLIFAFSETHLSRTDSLPPENLHPLYTFEPGNDRPTRHGGTGLLIHQFVKYKCLNQVLDPQIESTCISFDMYSQSVIFATVYLPQQNSDEITRFMLLLDKILDLDPDLLIITGDFNSRHHAWGDSVTNSSLQKTFA